MNMTRNLKVAIPTFRTMRIAKATVMKATMMEVRVMMKAMVMVLVGSLRKS